MDGDPKPYHHGDLRAALLVAGEAELAGSGPEGFSLRRVAKRAGVSHAAPAHHFRDVRGLLTALAARGFDRLLEMQAGRAAEAPDDARAQLLAYGMAYVDFACAHPALFRLTFGSNLPDHSDPELCRAGEAAFMRMAEGVAAVTGRPALGPPEEMVDAWRVWSLTHGVADLLSSGHMKGVGALQPGARDDLIREILSAVLP